VYLVVLRVAGCLACSSKIGVRASLEHRKMPSAKADLSAPEKGKA
jgi:hypothetical protein